jgi:hypothetical protein
MRFDYPAQQIGLQDYIHAVEDAENRFPAMSVTALINAAHRLGSLSPLAPIDQASNNRTICWSRQTTRALTESARSKAAASGSAMRST